MDFGTPFGVFMLLAVLIVLGRWLKSWGQRMAERRAERDAPDPAVERALEQEQLVLDDTPDGPVPFGYKTSWAAVKCGSPDEVINALQLSGRRAGWTTGLAAAMRGQGVFVSPLPGWLCAGYRTGATAGASGSVRRGTAVGQPPGQRLLFLGAVPGWAQAPGVCV